MNKTSGHYFIVGDENARVASYTNSFTDIPTSDLFGFQADPNSFGTWNKTVLDNNVEFTKLEYVRQTTGVDNSFVQFNFQLMGHVPMKKIYIELPLTMKYLINTQPISTPGNYTMPEFVMMDVIQQAEIRMGESLLMMDKISNMKLMAIKMKMHSLRMSPQEKQVRDQFGSNKAICARGSANISTRTDLVSEDFQQNISTIYKNVQGAPAEFQYMLAIPLHYLCSFFNQDGCLPQQMRFDIILRLTNNFGSVRGSSIIYSRRDLADASSALAQYQVTNIKVNNSRIVYPAYHLTPNIEKAFNTKWLYNNLQYNYFKWDSRSIMCDGVNTIYSILLTINQQIPLFIAIQPLTTSKVGYEQITPTISPNPAFYAYYSTGTRPYFLSRLTIARNGIEIKDVINNNAGSISNQKLGKNAYELISNASFATNEIDNARQTQSQSNHSLNNSEIVAPYFEYLQGADFYNKQIYSAQQQASNIEVRMNISDVVLNAPNTTFPLPAGTEIRIWFATINQVQINAARNIIDIGWPAISVGMNDYIMKSHNTQ